MIVKLIELCNMRTMLKTCLLATMLLLMSNVSMAATCPDIATAIKQINGVATLTTGVKSNDSFTKYSGTSSFDQSTVSYYTVTPPTAVTSIHQLKSLAAALGVGVPLVSASANDTSVSCVYLGSMTGTSDAPIPVADNTWQQIILIKSSGAGPTPPPPGQQVAAKIEITGDLATLGGQSVPITLTGSASYGSVTIEANGSAQSFATINVGAYTVGPAYVIVNNTEYDLDSAGPFTVSTTQNTIAIQYNKVPEGSGTVAFNLSNDRTLTGAPASSAQTLTFTSLSGTVSTENFILTNGVFAKNFTLPNGTYNVTLTAPSNYNAVLPSTVRVLTNSPVTLNADYKYQGTYVYLTPANYALLLSTKDQTINLGQGFLSYHCTYVSQGTFPYYQKTSCDTGDFEFPTTERTINGIPVKEDVLWAMSTAMASIIERMEFEYGYHPFTGMPNKFPNYKNDAPLYPASNIKVIGTGGINTLGDYLYENISPNYLLARCLQESNRLCALTGPGPSGAFQIDSFTIALKVANVGGYAMPFSFMNQAYVIGTPGGPFDPGGSPANCGAGRDCSNFVGGVISSAFFDTTAYTPRWSIFNAWNVSQVMQISTTLPDVVEYLSSIFYNQGEGSLSNAFFAQGHSVPCATTNYTGEGKDIRFDGACFLTAGTGAQYPFQLPDVNHNFLEMANTQGGHFYQNSNLTWPEISAFLDLIGTGSIGSGLSGYGFYDQYDIAQAKIAALAAFTSLAGTGKTIDFQTQFPIVLNAIMQTLPVYLSEACIPGQAGC